MDLIMVSGSLQRVSNKVVGVGLTQCDQYPSEKGEKANTEVDSKED